MEKLKLIFYLIRETLKEQTNKLKVILESSCLKEMKTCIVKRSKNKIYGIKVS